MKTFVATAVVSLIFFMPQTQAQDTVIRLPGDSTPATVKGRVNPLSSKEYQLSVSAGQRIAIHLTSTSPRKLVQFNLKRNKYTGNPLPGADGVTDWEGTLKEAGEYWIAVFALPAAGDESFTLVVSTPSDNQTVLAAKTPSNPGASTQNSDDMPIMVAFADLKWTKLPEREGMMFALLSGDPAKGEYTQIRKVPAGTANPLHSHSSRIKNVIISGVWYTGATDAASAKDFGPGSVVVMPANWVHVSGCRAGSDCLFYQEGRGKFDFKPVETTRPE